MANFLLWRKISGLISRLCLCFQRSASHISRISIQWGQPNISVFNETRWLAPPPCWPHGQRLVQLPMRKHQRCTTRQRVADHARHVPQDVCYVAVWRAALQDCLDRACDVSRKDISRCCLGPTLVQLPSQLPTISAISQDDNASRRLQIIGSNQRRRQISGQRRWQISV